MRELEPMMRHRVMSSVLVLGLLMSATSCDTKGSATVSCNSIAKLQTGLGLLEHAEFTCGKHR